VVACGGVQVTEPTSTGIGGDCFCLFFNAETGEVRGLNGSGRCPAALTVAKLKELGVVQEGAKHLPRYSPHTVTVPGAAAGTQIARNLCCLCRY
jgi:gamma-glutamyltranspeptidase/glutathione hydrolase